MPTTIRRKGPLHTDFGLSAGGESVILYNVTTKQIIDRIDYPGPGNRPVIWAQT